MKNVLLSIVVLIMISCAAEKESVITPDDKQVLTEFKEVLWPKAYREQDTVLLDQLLDESFQLISDVGATYSKTDELAWIKEHAMAHDSFRYEIKRLDIYENGTAIVSGTGHIINDSAYSFYQSSNVLIKKAGIWKAISSHVSGVQYD
ncbi:MAG: nuclear transport factor 2 family protein [Cyclobacteriaceae bacterium]